MTDSHILSVFHEHTRYWVKLHLKGKINNILPGVGKNNLCVGVLVVSHDILRTVSRKRTGEERGSS